MKAMIAEKRMYACDVIITIGIVNHPHQYHHHN